MTFAPNSPRWRRLLAVGAAAALAVSLTACSTSSVKSASDSQGKSSTVSSAALKVYATPVPQGDVLEYVQKLADADGSGLKLKITASQQGLDSNELLANGDVDANFNQHVPYFKSWIAAHSSTKSLVNAATVLVNIFGLYSDKYKSAKDIPNGSKILVPNEPSGPLAGTVHSSRPGPYQA